MILDSHTHIGKKTLVASAQDLVKSMDAAHIDKALVFAGKINEQATEILLDDIEPFKGRLYGIGSVSPLKPSPVELSYNHGDTGVSTSSSRTVDYLERCFQEQRIYGLKFYTGYEWFYPSDPVVRDYLELCVKYDKPAIFHAGDCYNGVSGAKLKYAHPLNFDDLAVEMPNLKIIIAHMGYPWIRDAAEVCYKNENVYADMSGFVYDKFKLEDFYNYRDVVGEFIKICGGSQKLIFGTDWPISDQGSYMNTVKELDFSDRDEIMGKRAARLFGIV